MLDAIEAALQAKNWYAALALTLCLPDICGGFEVPEVRASRLATGGGTTATCFRNTAAILAAG